MDWLRSEQALQSVAPGPARLTSPDSDEESQISPQAYWTESALLQDPRVTLMHTKRKELWVVIKLLTQLSTAGWESSVQTHVFLHSEHVLYSDYWS